MFEIIKLKGRGRVTRPSYWPGRIFPALRPTCELNVHCEGRTETGLWVFSRIPALVGSPGRVAENPDNGFLTISTKIKFFS